MSLPRTSAERSTLLHINTIVSPGLDLVHSCKRTEAVWKVCSNLSRPPAETTLADRWSCFAPSGSQSVLLKGFGTLNSPCMLPWCHLLHISFILQKSLLILANVLKVVTACVSFDEFVFPWLIAVISTMPRIHHLCSVEHVSFLL